MFNEETLKITDFPEEERFKVLKTQYTHEEKILRDKLDVEDMGKRYDIVFWISMGLLGILFSCIFFNNNTEVPKVAGSVLISLLSYLAGRASR